MAPPEVSFQGEKMSYGSKAQDGGPEEKEQQT